MCPWFWQGERSKSCAQFIASLVCIAFVNCGEDKEQWSFPLVHPIFNQIGPFYMTGQRVASQIIRCYQTFDVSSQSLPLWRYMTVSNRRTLTIYEFRDYFIIRMLGIKLTDHYNFTDQSSLYYLFSVKRINRRILLEDKSLSKHVGQA